MEHAEARELTAAYALDALDEPDERAYAEHLRVCADCREELDALTDAAASLAYAGPAAAPAPGLRDRILERARSDGSNVIPLRRRRTALIVTSTLAAAAAVIAVGLGIWASSLATELDEERAAARVLADPTARTVELDGALGRVVVAEDGRGVLVSELQKAPDGQTYVAWVITDGGPARPAGAFDGAAERDRLLLKARVPRGALIALTIERSPDVAGPSQRPFATANT